MSNPQIAPEQIRVSHDYLAQEFVGRPSLEDVAQALIDAWISEWFTGTPLRARNLWIGVIQRAGDSVTHSQLTSLSDALIQRCMSRQPLNYTPGHHRLLMGVTQVSATPATAVISVDDVELMINSLATDLVAQFQARMVRYWNDTAVRDPLSTRWRMVSDQLRKCLKTARQNPSLSGSQRSLLNEIYPCKADRQRFGGRDAPHIFQLYAVNGEKAGEWVPLLVFQWAQEPGVHVYIPAMYLLKLDSLDQLGRLLPRYMSHYLPDQDLRWTLKEPEGDVFDGLAQSLLEKQLRDLSAVDWTLLPRVINYKRLFNILTSPLVWFEFGNGQEPSEDQLPLWLQTASALERQTYGHWLGRLADVQQQMGGAHFLDDIDSINVYARKALQRQMALDHPREALVNPDDYVLTFTHTQGGAVGWTQDVSRTLSEWSLERPFATAYARLDIHNRKAPDKRPAKWLTPDYLKRLISAVDVGKHYPALLKDRLILDTVESDRRRQLFVDQMCVQLPMLAFEYLLQGLGDITASGYRVIQAMTQARALLRVVDGMPIVARHLAFRLHAGGSVHRAFNFFVIGPRDNAPLPHILYHPSGGNALRQFSSRHMSRSVTV